MPGSSARAAGRCRRARSTLRNALVWMALQSAVGAAVLFKLNKFAGGLALASLVLIAIYPMMKRFTSWPQVVLGLAFNWGALVGYAAVTGTLSWAALALYAGGVAWTLVYDTIYAMQDQRDDASSACARPPAASRGEPRRWLALFAALALLCWALAGCSRPAAASTSARPGRRSRCTSPGRSPSSIPTIQADCLAKFRANALVGLLLTAHHRRRTCSDGRLPGDPEGFIRANTALEAPAMVPEFKLWLASEYLPIWQATEAWLEEQNVDPPYWAFCWPGGQAIARYLLDNPGTGAGKRVIDFAAGSGVSSLAAARAGAASVIANDIDALSLVAARLNAEANDLAFEISAEDWLAGPEGAPDGRRRDRRRRLLRARHVGRALAWLRGHAGGPAGAAGRPWPQLFQCPRARRTRTLRHPDIAAAGESRHARNGGMAGAAHP